MRYDNEMYYKSFHPLFISSQSMWRLGQFPLDQLQHFPWGLAKSTPGCVWVGYGGMALRPVLVPVF